jgi:hypothetical protein
MADQSAANLWRLKWTQIILSALTTGGAVGVVFSKSSAGFAYTTAILSVATLILNSYAKDLDPGQEAQKHRAAASDIWNVRESYLSLLTDIRDITLPIAKLRERRDHLQTRLHEIYHGSPHTNGKAYGDAQDALKNREELTFTDAEIDAFLPPPLKRTKP